MDLVVLCLTISYGTIIRWDSRLQNLPNLCFKLLDVETARCSHLRSTASLFNIAGVAGIRGSLHFILIIRILVIYDQWIPFFATIVVLV